MKKPPAPSPSRRGFLNWFLGLGVIGWLGSILYPVIRYLSPQQGSSAGGPVKLSGEELQQLQRRLFTIVRSGTDRILVFEDGSQQVRALAAKCTHEGCTVQFVPGEAVVWCACHNGRFDLDGRVLSGPPPRPLPRYLVKREGDGSVSVALEKA